jgi:TusA-related sulfurtransferase
MTSQMESDRQTNGEMNATITRSMDLRGVPDGVQLATAAVAMLELRPGELLEVLTRDPHAPRDFSVWCRAAGHRLVSHKDLDGVHRFVIERSEHPRNWRTSDAAGRAAPPSSAVFSESELEGLPGPVQRYFRFAIAPGTPLATSARLRMHGRIKIGHWLPFRARQVLAPRSGFTWSAWAGGVLSGFDRYAEGQGAMRWKLLGVLPVMRADGPDVTRSSAERAAAEAIWLPTTLLPRFGVRWEALDNRHLLVRYDIDGAGFEARYRIDADGRLVSMVFHRWGDPDHTGTWGPYPFGGEVTAYRTFDGLSIPSAGRFGWFFGTDRWLDGEFFRYEITKLQPIV